MSAARRLWSPNLPCMPIPAKGRRPSFVNAAPPEIAEPLVERFAEMLQAQGVPTQTGQFGAEMLVEIDNHGPVTILIERD